MGISALGLLLSDFNFIVVALFSKHLPGGYWFLVVGPIAEGLLGGRCPLALMLDVRLIMQSRNVGRCCGTPWLHG